MNPIVQLSLITEQFDLNAGFISGSVIHNFFYLIFVATKSVSLITACVWAFLFKLSFQVLFNSVISVWFVGLLTYSAPSKLWLSLCACTVLLVLPPCQVSKAVK